MASSLPFICARCLRTSARTRSVTSSRHNITIATNGQTYTASRHNSTNTPSFRRTIPRIQQPTKQLHPQLRTYASTATQEHSDPQPAPLPINSTTRSQTSSATSVAASGVTTTTKPTTAVLNPQLSETGTPLAIAITPRAAHRLHKLMQTDQNPQLALRITVESGGCHGFQYLMSVISSDSDIDLEEDTLFVYDADVNVGIATADEDGVVAAAAEMSVDDGKETARRLGHGKAKVVMDSASLELLEGSKIDYTMELIGSQFKIVDNPRATSSCGCGTSFDIKI